MQIELLINSDKLWHVVAEYAQNCSWKAGPALAKQMKECLFSDWERVFAALDGDRIGITNLSNDISNKLDYPGIRIVKRWECAVMMMVMFLNEVNG